jgi:predicted dehydrogenase
MLGETVLISAEGNDPVQQITYPAVSTERMELEAFARAIDGEPYPVSVADALHGVSVLEAIAASARDGQPRDVEA